MRLLRIMTLLVVLTIIIFFVINYILSRVITLVYGGEEVQPGELPWVVYLNINYEGRKNFCGGALVDSDWVITAAHCIRDPDAPESITAYLNTTDIRTPEIKVTFDRIIVHEGYAKIANSGSVNKFENDLALLRFNLASEEMAEQIRDYFASLAIKPLDPSGRDAFASDGDIGIIAGWGETENKKWSNKLLKATVRIVGNDKCNHHRIYDGAVTEGMLCAAAAKRGASICRGDSGGPLIVSDGVAARLVGVASWRDKNCANRNKPSVFMMVETADQWIARTIAAN